MKKAPAIQYDKVQAHKSRIRARKHADHSKYNPNANLFNKLKKRGKVPMVHTMDKDPRPMSYLEWMTGRLRGFMRMAKI